MGIRNTVIRGKKAKTIQKLYKHWREEDAVSTKYVSDDSSVAAQENLDEQSLDKHDSMDRQYSDIQNLKSIELDDDSVTFNLPARYVLQGVFVVSLLLIMLSVMLTVLLSRSCS